MQIDKAVSNLDVGKAGGPDNISAYIIANGTLLLSATVRGLQNMLDMHIQEQAFALASLSILKSLSLLVH
jgi:hypothetical protein